MNGRTDKAAPPTYVFDTNVIIRHLNDGNSVLWKGERFISVITEHEAIHIRREGFPRLKLPDAIIAATAVVLEAQFITTDDKLLRLVWPGFNVAVLSAS
jgi:predicted nucleic acid-binding protein